MSFAKFFEAELFKGVLDEAAAKVAAQRADEILVENATLVFGTLFNDKTAADWSSHKDDVNTHVGLLVGAKPMAAFAKSGSYVSTGKTSEKDLMRAQSQRIAILEAQLKQSGGYGG